MTEHIAYVPYAELVEHFREWGEWTCVICGGPVGHRSSGHERRRAPLFECADCGRRSDGCQTFEGHHVLYGGCALEDRAATRCGHWLCSWARPAGKCPVCGAARESRPTYATARGR